jgi:hypothetical protein
MHDTVGDDDVRLVQARPSLIAQLSEEAAPDRTVPLVIAWIRLTARQHFEEIGAADGTDKFAVVHHRHTLDPPRLHQIGDLAEGSEFTNAGSRVMTSATRRAWDLMYSAAKREFGENHSLHPVCCRSVPVELDPENETGG